MPKPSTAEWLARQIEKMDFSNPSTLAESEARVDAAVKRHAVAVRKLEEAKRRLLGLIPMIPVRRCCHLS